MKGCMEDDAILASHGQSRLAGEAVMGETSSPMTAVVWHGLQLVSEE